MSTDDQAVATSPFTLVGGDAPVCVDGVCVLPATPSPQDPAGAVAPDDSAASDARS